MITHAGGNHNYGATTTNIWYLVVLALRLHCNYIASSFSFTLGKFFDLLLPILAARKDDARKERSYIHAETSRSKEKMGTNSGWAMAHALAFLRQCAIAGDNEQLTLGD